jgi:hypothetical protein
MKVRWTRPNLPKLNIDFAELWVTSHSPARFEGITSQGREVWVKYRNGCLQIHYSDTDEVLLEQSIGDQCDMEMLLEQLCDLVGFTILGETPILSPEAYEAARRQEVFAVRDWSGATTYWSIYLNYTGAAGLAFLIELEKLIPGTFVNFEGLSKETGSSLRGWAVRRLTDGIDLWGNLYLGADPDNAVIVRRLDGEIDWSIDQSLVINIQMPINTRSRNYDVYDSAFVSKSSGRTVHIHPTFRGRMMGEIKTASKTEQRRLEEIENLVARHFFRNIKGVDIDSGEVIARHPSGVYHSRDLVGWCDAKKMKFLSASSGEDKTRPIGYLPDLDGEA